MAEYYEETLDGVHLGDDTLHALRVLESTITRLDAPVLGAPRAHLRDVAVRGSRVGAAELYESDWMDVVVEDSKLDWVNLRNAKLRRVVLRRCRIGELDLGGAQVRELTLDDCDVASLVLEHARCQDVDLRGARIDQVGSVESLRGASGVPDRVGSDENLAIPARFRRMWRKWLKTQGVRRRSKGGSGEKSPMDEDLPESSLVSQRNPRAYRRFWKTPEQNVTESIPHPASEPATTRVMFTRVRGNPARRLPLSRPDP